MPPNYKKFHCLIVDDYPEMRSSLGRMLESFGCGNMEFARNGNQAIGMMEKFSYDIILCDYYLGEGKNGQQVLEEAKIKELIRYDAVFILITAEANYQVVIGAVVYEPDDYLTKPFNKATLKSRLDKIIDRKNEFRLVQEAVAQQNHDKIITICDKKLLEDNKYKLDYFRLKANSLLETGKYESAADIYSSLLAERHIPWAALGLGIANYYERRYDEAVDIFRKLVAEQATYIKAYDWIAKCELARNQPEKAQESLASAVEIIPYAVARQQELAKVAFKNQNFNVAERALKSVVEHGKYSLHRTSADFTRLSKAMRLQGNNMGALKVVSEAQKELRGDKQAALQLEIANGLAFHQMKKEDEAKLALQNATNLYQQNTAPLPPDIAFDFTRLCMSFKEKDMAKTIMEGILSNYIDDEQIVNEAIEIFDQAGIKNEGEALIELVSQKVNEINNEGVQLASSGDFLQAINLFEKANLRLPNNPAISLNAAQAILLYLKENNNNDTDMMKRAKSFLNQAKHLGAIGQRYQQLMQLYMDLTNEA